MKNNVVIIYLSVDDTVFIAWISISQPLFSLRRVGNKKTIADRIKCRLNFETGIIFQFLLPVPLSVFCFGFQQIQF